MENTPFIHIENLSYSYVGEDDKPIPVLKDLSLNIREGEYVVILGHNGSGKSTFAKLLNLVIDDYTFAKGKITVNGFDVMSPDLTDEDIEFLLTKPVVADEKVIQADFDYYSDLGFKDISCFACYLGSDYVELHGEPDITAFAKAYHRLKSE